MAVLSGVPYLVNLHADAQLSGKLTYYLREGVTVMGTEGNIKVCVRVCRHPIPRKRSLACAKRRARLVALKSLAATQRSRTMATMST